MNSMWMLCEAWRNLDGRLSADYPQVVHL
jgi:hypothetical protein